MDKEVEGSNSSGDAGITKDVTNTTSSDTGTSKDVTNTTSSDRGTTKDVTNTTSGDTATRSPEPWEATQNDRRYGPKVDPKYEKEIRSRGLQLRGECMPKIEDIAMTYRDAWRIGKQGCLAVRRNLWDPHLFSGTWYFVCDGTDPSNFLVLHPHNSGDKMKCIVISMWELIDAFWVANKLRVLYQPKSAETNHMPVSTKTMVIEGFTRDFYEAMIMCIHEAQVRLQLMYIELKDLQKQFTKSDAGPCKVAASRGTRGTVGYSDQCVLTSGANKSSGSSADEDEHK
ncbi:hypothetical protein BaOVIS_017210 [Babesia ovis]|uniref:Uncharacterized protein n=1 Tax=Babesia ovis TaxID=5869 RepID=A0A9W5TD92_BABOV|nr:hypothetical protein BaOVIS_017210 [Babesia ovis]